MPDLDSLKFIAQIDRQNMGSRLCVVSEEMKKIVASAKTIKVPKQWQRVSNIAIIGMGASGIGGEIVKNIASQRISMPIEVINDYELPAYIGKGSLVFCVSFSGETEETITAADRALKQKANLFIITKEDSSLGKFARKNKIRTFRVTAPPPPRLALMNLLIPILFILEKLRLVVNIKEQLEQTVPLIQKTIDEIQEKRPTKNNLAKRLALELSQTIPVVITSPAISSVGQRFVQQINEDAKRYAFYKTSPELNHNFIEAISRKNSYLFTIIKSSFDSPSVQRAHSSLESILKARKIPYEIILLQGRNLLSQIFFGITLLDFRSFYIALLNQENPSYNLTIDLYKKELKEKQK